MPATRRRSRPAQDRGPVLDRSPQNLPLVVGTLATVHGRPRRGRPGARLRRRIRWVAAMSGVLSALGGALLTINGPDIAVSRRGDMVRVGDSVLTAGVLHPEVFTGDATLVLHPLADGSLRAAASTVAEGRPASGVCLMPPRRGWLLDETCELHVGGRRMTAVDHLDVREGPTWHRRYDDGLEVGIAVAPDAAVVPVPFPIGR
ncbi:MAG: hypothetical protein ABR564_00130 [Candidatus Dormibacteria bacterium]